MNDLNPLDTETPTLRLTLKGRVMSVDLGEKRIGIAVSDATRTIAKSYLVLKRKSRHDDFSRIQAIITEQKITLLVMGLPIPLNGVEGKQAAWVRHYTAELSQNISVPVEFWDESLSTVQAEDALRAQGLRNKKIKEKIDATAAAVFLQSYLNAQRQV